MLAFVFSGSSDFSADPALSASVSLVSLGSGVSSSLRVTAVLDAKLVRPPGLAAAEKPPPTPENPLPREPKPVGVADLKTDGVEAPRVPNGDFSDPANPARLDDANAEAEVFSEDSSVDAAFFPNEVNGESPTAFANALPAKP